MILVTGGTGFVGAQVVRYLLGRGCDLRLVVREGSVIDPSVWQQCDIRETKDLFQEEYSWFEEVLKNITTVVHLAWYSKPGEYITSLKNLDSLHTTLELARASCSNGVNRFIGIGSCLEYQMGPEFLSVDMPLEPSSLYAACKVAGYQILSEIFSLNDIEFAWCRLFYLYGEGEDRHRLSAYIRSRLAVGKVAELTAGAQVRDFLDVEVAGRAIAEVAVSGKQGPQNICSGTPITVREFAEQIADNYGRRDLLKFGIRPENQVDPARVVGLKSL